MKRLTNKVITWVICVTCCISYSYASDFEKVGEQKQVTLYERWIPSETGEQVRELKAEFTIQSDLATIVQLLKDEAKGKNWNVNATDHRIRSTSNPAHWLTYTLYDIPWPFDDQDCLVRYELKNSQSQTIIGFESILDKRFPIKTKVDRVTGVQGSWVLKQIDRGRIRVVYRITSDRSSKVPRWISDKVIHSNLYSTMAAFKAEAEKAA